MSILGLDIGAKYIRAVVANGVSRTIQHAYTIETPEFAVKDGELKDIQAVAGSVRNLILSHNLRVRELYIALRSPQLTNREVKFPKMKQEEIPSAVEFDLSQVFPNIQQTNTISHIQYTKPGTAFTGLAVFCPTRILDSYMKLAEELDIPLYRIDASFNATIRSLEYYGIIKHKPDSLVILDVGFENSQITILTDGKIALSRHMAFGARSAVRVPTLLELDSAMEPQAERYDFSPIVEQLVQTLDYYKYTRTEEPFIDGVFLLGGGAHSDELTSQIEDRLSLPVKILEAKLKGIDKEDDSVAYLSAVGSLLKKPERVADLNLLPDFRILTREKSMKKKQAAAVLFLAFFAVVFAVLFGFLQYEELLVQQEAESLSQRMVIYSEVNGVKQDIADTQASIDNINTILDTAQSGALINTDILDDIMSTMPEGVFIQSYSATKDGISMSGIAKTRPDIAEYIYRLKNVGRFGSVTTGSISARLDKDGAETDFSFNLSVTLN